MKRPLNTFLLGGCMVHWPIVRTVHANGILFSERYGRIREVHTFGEMFQLISLLRGQTRMAKALRSYAHLSRKLRPVADEAFQDMDLILLGPSSPIELTFRDIAVNRIALMRHVTAHIEDDTGWAEKLAARWLRIGLVGLNDDVRANAATKLVEYVRGDSEDAELARAAVLETRATRSDLVSGFHKMREMFSCPIGVILYIFRYMPDGRPISWPSGFREDVLDAAARFQLPVFDPAPLVQAFGVKEALLSGHSHYSKAFMPEIGKAMVAFAESVYEGRGDSCPTRVARERRLSSVGRAPDL